MAGIADVFFRLNWMRVTRGRNVLDMLDNNFQLIYMYNTVIIS